MAINVKVNEDEKEEELDYPLLMKSDDGEDIILMIEDQTGMVINSPRFSRIGYYTKSWYMDKFKPFHGTIELSSK